MIGYFIPCALIILKGTNHSLNIVGMDCLRRFRIERSEHLMQIFRSFLLCQPLQFRPVRLRLRFFRKINVIKHGLDIESRTAHQNGNMSSVINLTDILLRPFLKQIDIERFRRIQNINHMMRHSLHLLSRDLGRADIHIAIYLHGIRGNDLAVYRLCQRDRQS